jgi:hypothetical protein
VSGPQSPAPDKTKKNTGARTLAGVPVMRARVAVLAIRLSKSGPGTRFFGHNSTILFTTQRLERGGRRIGDASDGQVFRRGMPVAATAEIH